MPSTEYTPPALSAGEVTVDSLVRFRRDVFGTVADVERLPPWKGLPRGATSFVVTSSVEHYAHGIQQGDIAVYEVNSSDPLVRLPGLGAFKILISRVGS